MENILKYRSTSDSKSIGKTCIICLLPFILCLIWGIRWVISDNSDISNAGIMILGIAIIFVFFIIWGLIYTVNSIILTDSYLQLNRHQGNIRIPLQDIQTIEEVKPATIFKLKGLWRADGVLGYWGVSKTKDKTKVLILSRRSNNWVLVRTAARWYVFSPNDIGLIEAVRQQMTTLAVENNTPVEELPTKTSTRVWISRAVAAAIVIFVLILTVLGYREPRMTCTSERLTVQAPWGISLSISDIASVDTIEWEAIPAMPLRTNGISLFGVNRGHFKTSDGEAVQISVSRGNSPVLVIKDKSGKHYFINREQADETRKVFQTLKQTVLYDNSQSHTWQGKPSVYLRKRQTIFLVSPCFVTEIFEKDVYWCQRPSIFFPFIV